MALVVHKIEHSINRPIIRSSNNRPPQRSIPPMQMAKMYMWMGGIRKEARKATLRNKNVRAKWKLLSKRWMISILGEREGESIRECAA